MIQRPHRSQLPEILHLDDEVLVVNKPAGVVLGSGRVGRAGFPARLLESAGLPGDNPLRIVHRLQEQASGAVVYARNPKAEKHVRRQFAEGRAEVTYLALVTGCVEDDGEIDIPLFYHKRAGKLLPSTRRGSPALTRYRVVERVAGNTLLECRPVKDRTDQLRAHLAAIGHPLTVDPEFGGGAAIRLSDYKPDYRPSGRHPERPLVERLTLHAACVSIAHPATGRPLRVAAPLPRDLRATLIQLRRLG